MNTEYKPNARHNSLPLTIEISDDLRKARYKGDSDSKPSTWKQIQNNALGQFIKIGGDNYYIVNDFRSINYGD